MILAAVEESEFYVMYVAKWLIYYLGLVDTGTKSIAQRQEEGVHWVGNSRDTLSNYKMHIFAQIYGEIVDERRQHCIWW